MFCSGGGGCRACPVEVLSGEERRGGGEGGCFPVQDPSGQVLSTFRSCL